ncbi:threonine ammonia-lyase [Euzebya tangerina]|uniref:threonine ammonia-lyase n=1 Tax=Euzebya tangerina TaxID=591198 RepID=UPI00196B386E|nr:threonine/serine dehydratase [Euzebya tangerina]
MPHLPRTAHDPVTGVDVAVPTADDVVEAARRLQHEVVRTPLLESPRLNDRLGGRILIKAESLQRVGAFKFRGAVNRISQLTEAERARGVLAFSSGNHAQAVAHAAERFGVSAVIVMPEDAPAIKIRNTRGYGAEVVLYDRYTQDREEVGRAIADDRGLVIVPPFNDPHIVAGQGTLGLEVIEQAAEMDAELDAFVVCTSGGGLTAGCALILDARSPGTEIWGVEPVDFDDTRRSLEAGERLRNDPDARSICDAVQTETPGWLTWEINRRLMTGVLTATDDQALQAMAVAMEELKIVVEPGGAVALAAVLSGQLPVEGRTIAVVCSGGNADPAMLARALTHSLE